MHGLNAPKSYMVQFNAGLQVVLSLIDALICENILNGARDECVQVTV